MRRDWLSLLAVLALGGPSGVALAQPQDARNPTAPAGASRSGERPYQSSPALTPGGDFRRSMVRVSSHGCTGTVIASGEGRTIILSCAHAFEGRRKTAAILLDMPVPEGGRGPESRGSPRLIGVDYNLDLSLIELPAGPWPVIPVAPEGHACSRDCVSVGYDKMKWDDGPVIAVATPTRNDGSTLWTKESPQHGRSGGMLYDRQAGVLLGVVQGYEVVGNPRSPLGGGGMYVNAGRVRRFVSGILPVRIGEEPRESSPGEQSPRGGGDPRGDPIRDLLRRERDREYRDPYRPPYEPPPSRRDDLLPRSPLTPPYATPLNPPIRIEESPLWPNGGAVPNCPPGKQ